MGNCKRQDKKLLQKGWRWGGFTGLIFLFASQLKEKIPVAISTYINTAFTTLIPDTDPNFIFWLTALA